MQSLHPRYEGSVGERRTIQFIVDRLTLLRLRHTMADFSKAVAGHSFSSIIETTVPGRSRETVLFVIPLNHAMDASPAEDGSFGIALGLNLLDRFRKERPALSIKVVFLGGEHEGLGETFLGTSQFLRTFYPVEPQLVIYLDLRSFPAVTTIDYGGRRTVAPLWLVNGAMEAFRGSHVPFEIQTGRLPVFRSGLAIAASPLTEFLAAGYPAILLRTDGPADRKTPLNAGAASLVSAIKRLTESFGEHIPREWDRHYIFFSLPFLPIIVVSETAYLVFIIAFVFLLLVATIFKIPQLKKYAATLKRNWWNIPFFLIATFAILLAASLLLDLVLAVRNFPTLWTHIPAVFLAFKLAFFFSSATLLFRAARRFPFAKNGSFYSAAALVFVVICVIVVAWINISFVRYFLWPLSCVVFFVMSRSRTLKIIFFLVFPLPVLLVLIDLLSIPELRVSEFIIFNTVAGNLLFSVVILPFALLLIRIRLFFPYRKKLFFTAKSFIFMTAGVLLSTAAVVVMLTYLPYDTNHPQPVLAEQIIDIDRNTNTLSLRSPAPLGELQIVDKNGVLPVLTPDRSYFLPLSDAKNYLSYGISVSRFSNRTNIDLRLQFRGEPFRIQALLSSKSDFKLYDANFPVEQLAGNRYALSVGMNPPPALLLQLTLPSDRSYTLFLEAYYVNRSSDVDIRGDHIALDHRLTFRRSLTLRL